MRTLQYCLKCPVCEKPMRDADSTLVDVRFHNGIAYEAWMFHADCANKTNVQSGNMNRLCGLREIYKDCHMPDNWFEEYEVWNANGWCEVLDAFVAFRNSLMDTTKQLVTHNVSTRSGVYLLRCNEYHKIGVGDNVEKRIKQLQTATPYEIIHIHTLPSKHPYELEHALHQRFASKRVRGEWFALTPDDVMYICGL